MRSKIETMKDEQVIGVSNAFRSYLMVMITILKV